MRFEKAEMVRKKISHMEQYAARSVIVSSSLTNADVFSLLRDEDKAYVNYLMVQNGTIVQTHTSLLETHLEEPDEEVLSFIHSIPYFDTRLKDFIIGQMSERTIIISQNWENEFIIKCRAWAESFEWLHGDDRFLSDRHLDQLRRNAASLSLPY